MQKKYGYPEMVSKYWQQDIDFYVLSNEDIGFIANLVTGTNEVYNFALPYPATVDLSDETIVVYALEFIFQASHAYANTGTSQMLMAFLSFLDKDFAATFRGAASDAEDEALKSKFARNIIFGHTRPTLIATAQVEARQYESDGIQDAIYYPPVPLDLVYPLFIDIVNQSTTIALATGNDTAADFTGFELVQIVVWFRKRKLTASEKSARSVSQRFAQLDA